jgi:septum formation protein
MKTPKILLASSSAYRRQLFQKLRLDFSWASPDIDESPLANESPSQLVARLATQKAKTLSSKYTDHLIIGSDQVATLDETIIGKPHSHSAATEQLRHFRGRELLFLTGLCLFNSKTLKIQTCVETYRVKFRDLSDSQIENYLQLDQPYDCAGSFKSEGLGVSLFSHMHGDDPNTLIGLPLIALTRMLNNEGVDPLSSMQF